MNYMLLTVTVEQGERERERGLHLSGCKLVLVTLYQKEEDRARAESMDDPLNKNIK